MCTDTMRKFAEQARGDLVAVVAENGPRETIAACIVEALNAGATYEQMADDTGRSIEELRAVRDAYPDLQSATTYTPVE